MGGPECLAGSAHYRHSGLIIARAPFERGENRPESGNQFSGTSLTSRSSIGVAPPGTNKGVRILCRGGAASLTL
jgi:hypothetical protein